MRLLFILSLILLSQLALNAHPSYGLVVNNKGEIFFCDVLNQGGGIWKIDVNGQTSKVLSNQHCHFIFLDSKGKIWGTNHEYLPSTKGNRNTLWTYTNNQKEIIIPPTQNRQEFTGVNFVIDKEENIYYDYKGQIFTRTRTGVYELYNSYRFERILSLQMDDHENIFVVDTGQGNGSIFKVYKCGFVELLADHLLEDHPKNPPYSEPSHNLLFGAFIDSNQNVYVANSGSRRISKITRSKDISHIYNSEEPWYPVAYYRHGEVEYIMETGFIPNEGHKGPRIVEIKKGKRRVLSVIGST